MPPVNTMWKSFLPKYPRVIENRNVLLFTFLPLAFVNQVVSKFRWEVSQRSQVHTLHQVNN